MLQISKMKIVISPAKSLNFEKTLPTTSFSQCKFLSEAKEIQKTLKQKSPQDLSKLMAISDNLAKLNWERNKKWKTPFSPKNAIPAVYAFDGDVYTGLDAYSLDANSISVLQNKLRILSGLYGLLKPLDLIQAYRLEMGTKLEIGNHKNLYDFWKKSITTALNKELKSKELFINLASTEYFSAVDAKLLKVPVITPEFKEYKNGDLKIIGFFAKKARGLMVRYIIDNNVDTIEALQCFDYENYRFDPNLSKGNKLIFTR